MLQIPPKVYVSMKCHYSNKISFSGHIYIIGWHCTTRNCPQLLPLLREQSNSNKALNPVNTNTKKYTYPCISTHFFKLIFNTRHLTASILTQNTNCAEGIFSPIFTLEETPATEKSVKPHVPTDLRWLAPWAVFLKEIWKENLWALTRTSESREEGSLGELCGLVSSVGHTLPERQDPE